MALASDKIVLEIGLNLKYLSGDDRLAALKCTNLMPV